jgi:hypothetical protein
MVQQCLYAASMMMLVEPEGSHRLKSLSWLAQGSVDLIPILSLKLLLVMAQLI